MTGNFYFNTSSIYLNQDNIFEYQFSSAQLDAPVQNVDITDDGKWMLLVESDGKFHLVQYNR